MKTLYRPVGLLEMNLILDRDLKGFPPRLPEQPIFYPVLNKPYADQIAREWNTKDKFSGYVGFVTEFKIESPFIDKYDEQMVGSKKHNELWVPAEELEELNHNIVGRIQLVDLFYGDEYKGLSTDGTIFEDKNLIEQFIVWKGILDHNAMDFYCEIKEHWKFIFINYPFWNSIDCKAYGITDEMKSEILSTMKEYWEDHFPDMKLLIGAQYV
ncbi:hypothetical protein [Paenibacillus monticola]|uniref:hypothetical protein n=1 Tax=Paenibacillus monticola TaxID=2666075 RepID=UPI00189D8A07|nr:hypothetical protein [Paenibacillus monticola]